MASGYTVLNTTYLVCLEIDGVKTILSTEWFSLKKDRTIFRRKKVTVTTCDHGCHLAFFETGCQK